MTHFKTRTQIMRDFKVNDKRYFFYREKRLGWLVPTLAVGTCLGIIFAGITIVAMLDGIA